MSKVAMVVNALVSATVSINNNDSVKVMEEKVRVLVRNNSKLITQLYRTNNASLKTKINHKLSVNQKTLNMLRVAIKEA